MRPDTIYRAWNKEYGMIYPSEHFTLLDALSEGYTLSFYGSPFKDYADDIFIFSRCLFAEDKWNHPIYQGDIIDEGDNLISLVEDGMMSMDGKLSLLLLRRPESVSGLTLCISIDHVKIIGNMWEHSELLEKVYQ